jgi:hypothetical protein
MNLRIVAEEAPLKFKVQKLSAAETEQPDSSAMSARTTLVYQNTEYADSPIWIRSKLLWGNVVQGLDNILHMVMLFTGVFRPVHCQRDGQ